MTTHAQDWANPRLGEEPWSTLPELDEAWGPDSPVTITKRLECAAWAIRHGCWDEASGLLGMAEHYSAGRRNTVQLWKQAKVGLAWCCWRRGNLYAVREHLREVLKSWKRRGYRPTLLRQQVLEGHFQAVSDSLKSVQRHPTFTV